MKGLYFCLKIDKFDKIVDKNNYNIQAILKAIEQIGSASKLAKHLDVSYQTVIFWKNGKVVPNPLNCIKIESITGGKVKREDILPNYSWDNTR